MSDKVTIKQKRRIKPTDKQRLYVKRKLIDKIPATHAAAEVYGKASATSCTLLDSRPGAILAAQELRATWREKCAQVAPLTRLANRLAQIANQDEAAGAAVAAIDRLLEGHGIGPEQEKREIVIIAFAYISERIAPILRECVAPEKRGRAAAMLAALSSELRAGNAGSTSHNSYSVSSSVVDPQALTQERPLSDRVNTTGSVAGQSGEARTSEADHGHDHGGGGGETGGGEVNRIPTPPVSRTNPESGEVAP